MRMKRIQQISVALPTISARPRLSHVSIASFRKCKLSGPSMHALTTASMMELDFITEKGRNAKQKRARMRGIVSRTA